MFYYTNQSGTLQTVYRITYSLSRPRDLFHLFFNLTKYFASWFLFLMKDHTSERDSFLFRFLEMNQIPAPWSQSTLLRNMCESSGMFGQDRIMNVRDSSGAQLIPFFPASELRSAEMTCLSIKILAWILPRSRIGAEAVGEQEWPLAGEGWAWSLSWSPC